MDEFMKEKGKYFADMKGNTTKTQMVKVMFEIAELMEAIDKDNNEDIINEGFDVMQSVMTLIMTKESCILPGMLAVYYDNWKKKIEGYISEGGKYNNK